MGEVRGIILILMFSCCLINSSFPIYSHMDIENNQSGINCYERLKNMKTNSFIEDVIPSSICYGNFLEETPENEIILGTKNRELFVLDHDLNIIFFLKLDSNAKKIEVVETDYNTKEKMLVISTEGEILLIDKYTKKESIKEFNKITDFKILDVNNDSKNEIIVLDGKKINCYNLSGEEMWSFEHDKSFFKIVPWNELNEFGGFLVSTNEKIHLFSSTGLCSFEVQLENEKIKDFTVCGDNIFILSDDNKIYKFNKMNKILSFFYPKENNDGSLTYISKMNSITAGIILHGYTGELQILSYEGERLLNEDYTYEVVSFEEKNLDNIQSEYMPKNNININSFEIIISITRGKINIFSEYFNNEKIYLKNQINYEVLDENDNYRTIRSTMIFPIISNKSEFKILVIDNEGNLRRYDLYEDHYETLSNYILALESFYNGKYNKSKESLEKICNKSRYSNILRGYGLYEKSKLCLGIIEEELKPKIEEGKINAEHIYDKLNEKKGDIINPIEIVGDLYSTYEIFSSTGYGPKEIIYENNENASYKKVTFQQLEEHIRQYLIPSLKDADDLYDENKFDKSLEYFVVLYPIMNNLMDQPRKYILDNNLEKYRDLGEKYENIDDILEKINLCIAELEKKSKEAFNNGDYDEAEDINEILIENSSKMGLESNKYEKSNEEIASIEEKKKMETFRIGIIIFTLFISGTIFFFVIKWKKIKYGKRELFILWFLISLPVLFEIIGFYMFSSLNEEEQIINLRYVSSSLLQSYIALLAIVPTINIALMVFFSKKYTLHYTKKIWVSVEIIAFFLAIAAAIAICFYILTSIPSEKLIFFLICAIFSMTIVIITIFLLIERINDIIDINRYIDNIEKDIRKKKDLKENFNDLILIVYPVIESEVIDFKILKRILKNFYDLVSIDNSFQNQVEKISEDICLKLIKRNEFYYLEEILSLIENHRGWIKINKDELLNRIELVRKQMDLFC